MFLEYGYGWKSRNDKLENRMPSSAKYVFLQNFAVIYLFGEGLFLIQFIELSPVHFISY